MGLNDDKWVLSTFAEDLRVDWKVGFLTIEMISNSIIYLIYGLNLNNTS